MIIPVENTSWKIHNQVLEPCTFVTRKPSRKMDRPIRIMCIKITTYNDAYCLYNQCFGDVARYHLHVGGCRRPVQEEYLCYGMSIINIFSVKSRRMRGGGDIGDKHTKHACDHNFGVGLATIMTQIRIKYAFMHD